MPPHESVTRWHVPAAPRMLPAPARAQSWGWGWPFLAESRMSWPRTCRRRGRASPASRGGTALTSPADATRMGRRRASEHWLGAGPRLVVVGAGPAVALPADAAASRANDDAARARRPRRGLGALGRGVVLLRVLHLELVLQRRVHLLQPRRQPRRINGACNRHMHDAPMRHGASFGSGDGPPIGRPETEPPLGRIPDGCRAPSEPRLDSLFCTEARRPPPCVPGVAKLWLSFSIVNEAVSGSSLSARSSILARRKCTCQAARRR